MDAQLRACDQLGFSEAFPSKRIQEIACFHQLSMIP